MWKLSLTGIIFIVSCSYYAYATNVKLNHDFDLLIFTQEWPATVCKEWKKHDPSHKCAMPTNTDSWTIHGIWPTKLGTIGPAFCNRTWMFDPEKIKPIEQQLTQVWVNVFGGTSVYALWSHEWTKHGTCAAQLKPFNSELNYFSIGINWMKQYSMTNILKSDPAIECKKEDGQSDISEIRICFTKDLELTNCDGIVARQQIGDDSILTNCDRSKNILYPQYINNHCLKKDKMAACYYASSHRNMFEPLQNFTQQFISLEIKIAGYNMGW
ncbi:unnamed protein product, partial [Brenthis ino]